MTMNWYAVNTKTHQEQQAEANLVRLGVETFCPQITLSRVIRRVRKTVIVPLFPGYLFTKLDLGNQFRSVTYARGVRKIVAFGSTPATVDEELIQAIRDRLRDGYVAGPAQVLTPGQMVRIQDGPLCGIEAVFEREMSGHQRAVLLLRTLAYQARVVVPFDQLQVANS